MHAGWICLAYCKEDCRACPQEIQTLTLTDHPAWYVIILHGMSLSCMVCHYPAWYVIILHGVSLSCMVCHYPAWCVIILHGVSLSCMVCHYPAWCVIILHGIMHSMYYIHIMRPTRGQDMNIHYVASTGRPQRHRGQHC